MLRRMMLAGGGGGPVPAGYLDALAVSPRAAMSLRKVVSTASSCLRVRRSSDNAEQDIGFVGDSVDTASLLAFAGAGSAYVTTLYDQTGNGENLVQAATARQPRIVSAGVYDGKLVFDGVDDSMHVQSLTLGAPQLGLYFRHALPGTYSTNNMLYELSPEFVFNGPGTVASYQDAGRWGAQSQSGNTPSTAKSFLYDFSGWTTEGRRTFLYDTTKAGDAQIRAWSNGALLSGIAGQTATQSGSYKSGADLFVGSRNNTSLFASLWLHTLVIYAADSSPVRESIEAIVGT